MRPTEVVTVTDARSMLPQLLSHLRDGGSDAEPVFIGAHRKAAGVLISVELFEELTALRDKLARREAVASARGSVTAEGLMPTGGFMQDAHEFTEGSIDADESARRAIERHSRHR